MGGDGKGYDPRERYRFQLTPPRGGRRLVPGFHTAVNDFNSRPRVGGDLSRLAGQSGCCYFNSRPRVGGDVPDYLTLRQRAQFQLTPPRGGRRSISVSRMLSSAFQLTPPRGGRPVCQNPGKRAASYFNSRPRVGGDTSFPIVTPPPPQFQLTPPRGGRREELTAGASMWMISTHAPAWGATLHIGRNSPNGLYFNSRPRVGGDEKFGGYENEREGFQLTPPRGGRRARRLASSLCSGLFQLTPPRGGRRALLDLREIEEPVFQLTPPRGGRLQSTARDTHGGDFNSRPRVGGDCTSRVSAPRAGLFQLTPPRGGRPTEQRKVSADDIYFNSRPRVGGDMLNRLSLKPSVLISTHAPAWGATCAFLSISLTTGHFNSRPRVGGDTRLYECVQLYKDFNSRPRVGGDPAGKELLGRGGTISTHAPAWGATRSLQVLQEHPRHFNSRPRVGGDRGLCLTSMARMISTHAPAWGATACRCRVYHASAEISTHAPAWGATCGSGRGKTCGTRYFNSRPRVGGDAELPLDADICEISTHAPAWGATDGVVVNGGNGRISTHAPAWGATMRSCGEILVERKISTHAPAWGATQSCLGKAGL